MPASGPDVGKYPAFIKGNVFPTVYTFDDSEDISHCLMQNLLDLPSNRSKQKVDSVRRHRWIVSCSRPVLSAMQTKFI